MAENINQDRRTGNEIAVIGMAGRFPDAKNIPEFWENLKNGVESLYFLSDEEIEASLGTGLTDEQGYVKSGGGVLEDMEHFDAQFFGYTPREAEIMNPQTRLFHECAWSALEDAGYNPESFRGLIGLYAGASNSFDWEALLRLSGRDQAYGDFAAFQLYDKDFLSTLVAHSLNFRGPALTLHTACSTSLVAIHLACQALLDGECDMALAGGVTIYTQRPPGYLYQEGMIFSPDGHCRAFDANSKGTVGGNGVGIVVLKALEEAEADGDHIYAVVKGTALNNDGSIKATYSAPSREGQTAVIRLAQQVAEVEPESITYIETHGTGTDLGDPIEIEALKQAFRIDKKGFCAIGALKTSMGHLDCAAGVAGFIKTVLALKHRLIPPTLHYQSPNPNIDFENTPFYVNTRLKEWKNDKYPLRAGVSSFGIGGTNAHIILEEAPVIGHSSLVIGENRIENEYQLVLLSAKTPSALEQITQNLADYLKSNPTLHLEDVAYTLQVGRKALQYRQAFVCSDTMEAIGTLTNTGETKPQYFAAKEEGRPVIFMFAGQGSQYVNMGLELYRTQPVFRREVDRCAAILEKKLGIDIREILYPAEVCPGLDREEEARKMIDDVIYSGPVKFTFDYALAQLIMEWGIKPYAMIGHSFGEYAAAHAAGVFSLEDALTVVVLRGQLMQKTTKGAMMGVPLSESKLKPLLGDNLSLAAINAPSLCIVSGALTEIEQLEKNLNEKGYECLRINFPRASHSQLMEPILNEFTAGVGKVKLNKPKTPYISGLTGNWIAADAVVKPSYWARHLRETVQFSRGLKKLLEIPQPIFVQVGSDRGLPLFVSHHQDPDADQQISFINLVRHPREQVSDMNFLLNQLGFLWSCGVKIDWKKVYPDQKRYRVSLPTYPFEGTRYWIDGNFLTPGALVFPGNRPGKKRDIADWFYLPSWIRSPLVLQDETTNDVTGPGPGEQLVQEDKPPTKTMQRWNWLVFIDEYGLGSRLVDRLRQEGHTVIAVKISPHYKQEAENVYCLNHKNQEQYEALIKDLGKRNLIPNTVAHLWSVYRGEQSPASMDFIDQLLDRGLCSLVYLVQAIGNQAIKTPLFIDIITESMQEVNGEERLSPGSATVMGAVKVLPLEYPNIHCRSIDILLPAPGTPQEDRLISQLAGELQTRPSETIVSYRGSHRWTQTFKPIRLEKPNPDGRGLKKQGVYMITGGLGGIGMELAEFIARTDKIRLVLIGRSTFPPKEEWPNWLGSHDKEDPTSLNIEKIRKLEELGAEVMTAAADVTDQQQMEAVIAQVLNRFGQINGVIHAAGVPGGGVIQFQARDTISSILAPKVKGTLVLNQVLKDLHLDFLIYCSSTSSIMSAFGQSGYCAANAFLDAMADYQASINDRYTTAINWGRWKETGMARAVELKHKEITGKGFSGGMTASEGVEAFSRILDQMSRESRRKLKTPRIIAIESDFLNDWQGFNRFKEEETQEGFYSEDTSTQNKPAGTLFPRPVLSSQYITPAAGTEKTLAEIWQSFFGYEQIGNRDDFFELGGDSLKATFILQRIHKQLDVKISIPEFFANPTVAGLAALITGAGKSAFLSIEPGETRKYYLQSPAQVRIYLLQQMEPGATAYHVRDVIELQGELEREKLEHAFWELIKRHESLRTSFFMINDIPLQQIRLPSELEFNIEYYTAKGKEDEKEIIAHFERPFDLSQPPLVRVGVVEIELTKHLLMVDVHHAATDGTSRVIFIDDFLALYEGKTLPKLRLQYRDFSQWQSRPEVKEALKQQKDYWIKEFSGEIPKLELPQDWPRPETQSFEGSHLDFALDREETKGLYEIARAHGATLFMVLTALYYILLFKLSNQEDIVVGVPTAGRNHPDLEHIIGMFVNTLALRNFPSGEKTFRVFLEGIKAKTLEAFENQDYPFEELVENVPVERDLSRSPLFDAMFILQNVSVEPAPKARQKAPGLKAKTYLFESNTSKFDITLTALEQEQVLFIEFEYCTRLFRVSTMQRYMKYFKQIVSAVVKNPGIKISAIEILLEEEKKQVLFDFNQTKAGYPAEKTLQQLFIEQAEQTPDRIALIGDHHVYELHQLKELKEIEETGGLTPMSKPASITYKELNRKSNQLAYLLQEKGIRPDTIAGILVERSIEMIIGIWGILKAGGAYLPIDPDYPWQRIYFILKDSNARVLLTTPLLQAKVKAEVEAGSGQPPDLPVQIINIDKDILYCPENAPLTLTSILTCQMNPADLAYIIYTSGTTGNPKGVMIQHYSLINRLNWMQKAYPLNENDTLLQKTAFTFDVSVWELFWWSITGSRLCLLIPGGEKDPAEIGEAIARHHVTVIHFVPSMLKIFLDSLEKNGNGNVKKLSSLKRVIASGEMLALSHVYRFKELLYDSNATKLSNLYGPTEATIDVSYYDCFTRDDAGTIPIGKPIDNIRLFVLDRYHRPQPIGVVGELCIAGDGLARGYINRPGLSAEKFCLRRPGGTLFEKTAPPGPPRKKFLLEGSQKDHRLSCNHASRQYHFLPPYYPIGPLPYHPIYLTGDLARWMQDGNIEFLGRIDHQIKIRGFRIEPGEIERHLLSHHDVMDTVVIPKQDENKEKFLCAYIVSNRTITVSELREYLSLKLPDYMIPAYFIPLEKILLTSSGKIDRKSLPEPDHKRPALKGIFSEPKTEIEKSVAGIWKEILKLEKIGINDDFFELGGNSLKIVSLNNRLKQKFEREIPVVSLFRYRTIQLFVKYLTQEENPALPAIDRVEALKRGEEKKRKKLDMRKRRIK